MRERHILGPRAAGVGLALANAVAYLMNDDFVTGTVLHAEGGQLLV